MVARMFDILCLQELRWTGGNLEGKPGPLVMDASYTIAVKKARNGAGICLSEYWQDKVIAVEKKPDRIIYLKLVIPGMSINI